MPPCITKQHQNLELAIDFFFVNGSPFLHTNSRNFFFSTVQSCNNRGKYKTILVLKKVKTKYNNRGFTITDYHGNNEFEHLRNFLAPAHLHICASNEHIGDIERSIWTIKEHVRCGFHSIPYKKFTKINDKRSGTRHDKLFKRVPIQRWDSKRPQISIHHPRVPRSRLQ